jgi:hypothetical protein
MKISPHRILPECRPGKDLLFFGRFKTLVVAIDEPPKSYVLCALVFERTYMRAVHPDVWRPALFDGEYGRGSRSGLKVRVSLPATQSCQVLGGCRLAGQKEGRPKAALRRCRNIRY